MNTILKAIVSLVVTAFVPIVEFGLLVFFFLAFMAVPTVLGGGADLSYGDLAGAILVMFAYLLGGFLISLMYTFLLGLPALLIGWYFRAIRWWTTLIMAFLIGAIPAAISILSAPIGQPEGTPLWRSTDPTELILVGIGVLIFGLVGLSSGLVFWLLWRYWVMPDSPAGRPRQVEMKPSGLAPSNSQ